MLKNKKILVMLLALAMVFALAACGGGDGEAQQPEDQGVEAKGELILATTTSTKDSGLLDYILADFTEKTGWTAKVISVGSGDAMAMGEAGEADVLLVHSPGDEAKFIENGHADADGRLDVMYNDFVIIGPSEGAIDPALYTTENGSIAKECLKKIAEEKLTFISRSDNSGTHKKELKLWEAAEIAPSGDWYVEAATGMGAVITMADERQAYTIADRATWLAVGADTDLAIVCENDYSGILYNQYGVICVNPEKNDQIKADGAKAFQQWITSAETQELIGTFGVEEYGKALFTPNAK